MAISSDFYHPGNPDHWHGRIDDRSDASTYRNHQVIACADLNQIPQKSGFALLGYACDEGVKRNQGRPGAKEGPSKIRSLWGNFARSTEHPVYDFGDYCLDNQNLEAFQSEFANAIQALLDENFKVIALGGGHDIAYAHGSGIWQHLQSSGKQLGIVNLDAHFDLRQPLPKASSGTPFYQLAQEWGKSFHYLAAGIQPHANTKKLYQTAAQWHVQIIEREMLRSDFAGSLESLNAFIGSVDHVYLTIDLDGLDASLAPGVSAPSVNGLMLNEVLPFLDAIVSSGKLISTDIAELCPAKDIDSRTARLAAFLIDRVMR